MTAITDSSNLRATLHGVLVNVDDIGVLIIGESGTGKSECALELVARRGHRLIADDIVEINRIGTTLFGRSPESYAGVINTPGLGILSVRDSFGAASFEPEHSIDICIQLETGRQREQPGQIGRETEVLGVKIPRFVFSDCRNRNLPLLAETAVKQLKNGENRAEIDFLRRHDEFVFASGALDRLNAQNKA